MSHKVDAPAIAIGAETLSALLPMHLVLSDDGVIVGAGATIRKILPPGSGRIDALFEMIRHDQPLGCEGLISDACRNGERLFLRMAAPPHLTLRGHGAALADGLILLNLGFGIGLVDAVRDLGLHDKDFAPPELAMELLFLHEAMQAMMGEMSRFNMHLDAAREAAEMQAFTDPLTGLYNRRGLEAKLAELLGAGRDPDRAGFAVAHLDLDHFKDVNDRLGHAAGDAVLCQVARILRDVTRAHDTAARVGGDEFLLLLDGAWSDEALARLARRIISGIEVPLKLQWGECRVSASMGILRLSGHDGGDAEGILAAADAALYQSKRAGRGQATIVTRDIESAQNSGRPAAPRPSQGP